MISQRARILRLTKFAEALGWPGLRAFSHEPEGSRQLIRWYEAGVVGGGRLHCALQINEHPIGSSSQFRAAIYAIRYRIFSGWHDFQCTNLAQASAEAQRLHLWLSQDWMSSAERRREYRELHPQCTGFTWNKLRSAASASSM